MMFIWFKSVSNVVSSEVYGSSSYVQKCKSFIVNGYLSIWYSNTLMHTYLKDL